MACDRLGRHPEVASALGSENGQWRLIGLLLLIGLLAGPGCTPRGPAEPQAGVPAAFSRSGVTPAPEMWWTAFGDEKLNDLVSRALRDNFSLRVAWDRLDQAHAVADRTAAPLLPSLDGTGGWSQTGRRAGATGTTWAREWALGLSVSYEVDLWGRVRSAYDATALDAEATKDDVDAAAISLAAEVTRTWYQLAEQMAQLALLDDQIATVRRQRQW